MEDVMLPKMATDVTCDSARAVSESRPTSS